MLGARRIHVRALLGAVVLFGILFLFLRTTSPSSMSRLESVKLDHFMNHGREKSVQAKKGTFDWSTIKFKYLTTDYVHQLPKGKPKVLPRVQHTFRTKETAGDAAKRNERRDKVREVFKDDWANYREFAWKKDALLPISGGSKEQFGDWAVTLVDSLDTLWLMGLRDEFEEALEAVAEINFGASSTPRVNMFETTIRYLGGLLSAYDLSRRDVLLVKAVELGDMLYAGFDTPNKLPVDFINFDSAKEGNGLSPERWVVSASPGTLSMEMTRLSQLTGDAKYYDAITRLMKLFEKNQDLTKLPGLWPIYISIASMDLTSRSDFTMGGSADSLFEYLPKMHALVGGLEPMYENMTDKFVAAADKYMFFRPMLPGGEDILISGNVRAEEDGSTPLDPESEHLTCFIGGTVALAGKLLNRPDYVDTGAKLTDGCAFVYHAFPSGVMPERYNMVPCEPKRTNSCPWNEEKFLQNAKLRSQYTEDLPKGFTTAKDSRYLLRPEAIESVFYMYRITGDKKYQETAWEMFESVEKMSKTKHGHASIIDVTLPYDPSDPDDNLQDYMEVRAYAVIQTPLH